MQTLASPQCFVSIKKIRNVPSSASIILSHLPSPDVVSADFARDSLTCGFFGTEVACAPKPISKQWGADRCFLGDPSVRTNGHVFKWVRKPWDLCIRNVHRRSNSRPVGTKSEQAVDEGKILPPFTPSTTPKPFVLVFGSDGQLQLSEKAREKVPPAVEESKNQKAKIKTVERNGSPVQQTSRNTPRGLNAKAAAASGPSPSLEEPKWKQSAGAKLRKSASDQTARPSAAPRYSKAARRFYNERFREAERLGKVLASAGVASRRAAEKMISDGRVTVNGSVCTVPQTRVDLLRDNIYVDGRTIPRKLPPKLYFIVNKPKGYICSSIAASGKTAISLVDEYMDIWRQRNPGVAKPRLFTVGRLDVATTGLLLITNDGEFAQLVSHPSSGLTKEYVALVAGKVSRRQMNQLAQGTEVDGVLCRPHLVEILEEAKASEAAGENGGHEGERGNHKGDTRMRVVVVEGRNREVRRILEAAGLSVTALKRVGIGRMRLPRGLGLGKFRAVDESEAKKLLGLET